ncbi:MAG: hypothetical protein ACE5H0_03600 [Bacteroidota bacterium]
MPPKPNKLQPALVGGTIIGVISAVPFLNLINCFCCAGVLLGGLLAVMFYKNSITPEMAPLSSGDAIGVGALAGVFGAAISTIVAAIIFGLFGNVLGEWMYEFMVQLTENAEIELPEEFYDQLRESLLEQTLGDLMLSFFVEAIIYTLFGLLGGLLGYAIFKPKVPPTVTTAPPTASAIV